MQLVSCYIFGRDLLSSDRLAEASMSLKTSSNTLKRVKYSTGKVKDSFRDIWEILRDILENEVRATLNSAGKNEEAQEQGMFCAFLSKFLLLFDHICLHKEPCLVILLCLFSYLCSQ